jgi:hypothetical protein
MQSTRLAVLTAAAALALSLAAPARTLAQPAVTQPADNPCPGGPQPITTSYVNDLTLFGTSPFVSPFVSPFIAPLAQIGTTIAVGDQVTVTQNVAGVQGLTQTVITNGFGSPTVSLGVPDYLLQAYGGNIEAIRRDLAAGLLKCRTS